MKIGPVLTCTLLTALACSSSALAEELSDPKEIIRRSKEAISNFKVVSYEATVEANDWLKEFVTEARGRAVVGRPAEHDVPRFACDVELKKKDSEGTASYKAGCDGNNFYLIDPATKTAHEDMDPVVLGSNARDIQRIVLRELNEKEPFKAELESESSELREPTEVGGEPCYQVYMKLTNAQAQAVLWEISRKDFWPRRVTRWYSNFRNPEGPEATTVMTITNLKLNPPFDKDPFKPVIPEGYTKTAEFAP